MHAHSHIAIKVRKRTLTLLHAEQDEFFFVTVNVQFLRITQSIKWHNAHMPHIGVESVQQQQHFQTTENMSTEMFAIHLFFHPSSLCTHTHTHIIMSSSELFIRLYCIGMTPMQNMHCIWFALWFLIESIEFKPYNGKLCLLRLSYLCICVNLWYEWRKHLSTTSAYLLIHSDSTLAK